MMTNVLLGATRFGLRESAVPFLVVSACSLTTVMAYSALGLTVARHVTRITIPVFLFSGISIRGLASCWLVYSVFFRPCSHIFPSVGVLVLMIGLWSHRMFE